MSLGKESSISVCKNPEKNATLTPVYAKNGNNGLTSLDVNNVQKFFKLSPRDSLSSFGFIF